MRAAYSAVVHRYQLRPTDGIRTGRIHTFSVNERSTNGGGEGGVRSRRWAANALSRTPHPRRDSLRSMVHYMGVFVGCVFLGVVQHGRITVRPPCPILSSHAPLSPSTHARHTLCLSPRLQPPSKCTCVLFHSLCCGKGEISAGRVRRK